MIDLYTDEPVEMDGEPKLPLIQGDPWLGIGLWEARDYVVLDEGDPVGLFNGDQGGWWVHMALRAIGVGSNGVAEGSVRSGDADGQVIGFSLAPEIIRLGQTHDGYLQAPVLRIRFFNDLGGPENREARRLAAEALDGEQGHLSVTYEADDGSSATGTAPITFAVGKAAE